MLIMSRKSSSRRMRIISEEEAIERIGPELLGVFAQVPHRAWKRYQENVAPQFANPPSLQLRVSMQTLMIEEAERAVADRSERVIRRFGRALLCAAPGIVVQFKALDDDGLPQNYPTAMATDFANQVELEGFPPGLRLTLGYELDALCTAIAGVGLVCQLGDRVVWRRDLDTNQQTIPLFAGTALPREAAEPAEAVRTTRQRRMRPKSTAVAKKKDSKKTGA